MLRGMRRLGLALLASAWSLACGVEAPRSDPSPAVGPSPRRAWGPEAGLVEVPARDIAWREGKTRIEATARLFTSFHPADDAPERRPLFVVFNGFSAEVVRAFGTGPTTVAEGGQVVGNPSSLTRLGSVLTIDPRQAGFSYDVLDRIPAASDCGRGVFNEYVDAADVLLATLAFLEAHPALAGPVVWVGESYGGVRAQWILAYLRGRWDLASYSDPTLRDALARSARGASLRAGQVLLQPWLAGKAHADAIGRACRAPALLADVAASVGAPCASGDACACASAAGRSRYNYEYADSRQRAREREAAAAHVLPARAEALLGLPLRAIPGLAPAARARGFKCSPPDADVPEQSELARALGPLPSGQFYYAPYSPLLPGKEVGQGAFDWRERDDVARAFIDNLRDVSTLITDGGLDLVVPTRALVPALVAVGGEGSASLEAPTRLRVATASGPRYADVRAYPAAGHMITMLAAADLSRDLAEWLAAR